LTGDDGTEDGLAGSGSGLFGVVGASFLVIFGRVILIGNCPDAGWTTNDATTKAAINNNDGLAITFLLLKHRVSAAKFLIVFRQVL
jgi:hypothetical protein